MLRWLPSFGEIEGVDVAIGGRQDSGEAAGCFKLLDVRRLPRDFSEPHQITFGVEHCYRAIRTADQHLRAGAIRCRTRIGPSVCILPSYSPAAQPTYIACTITVA
jgi:hypothetical protein